MRFSYRYCHQVNLVGQQNGVFFVQRFLAPHKVDRLSLGLHKVWKERLRKDKFGCFEDSLVFGRNKPAVK